MTETERVARLLDLSELARWLNERLENCKRIAAMKPPIDRIGWLDDARHFAAAIAVVDAVSDAGVLNVDHLHAAGLTVLPLEPDA